MLRRRLEFLWAKKGRIQVSDLSNDFFLVRFSEGDDYQRAAFTGPWTMFDHYIIVARWTPELNEEEPLRTILTWVRMPKLPIHFFNQIAVARIGNQIGQTVRMDLATSEGARARYARVCVKVDLSKPLLGKYMIGDRTFYVEYECLGNMCYTCGMYGHKLDECPTVAKSAVAVEDPQVPEAVEPPGSVENDTGSWMTVTRCSRKKPVTKVPQAQQAQGNRFDILRDEVPTKEKGKSKVVLTPKAKTSKSPAGGDDPIASLVDITNSIFKSAPAKSKKSQVATLGDITNVQVHPVTIKSSNGAKPSDTSTGDENLVSVPILLHEPNFQSIQAGLPKGSCKFGTKVKGKAVKSTRVVAGAGGDPKIKNKVKSFVPKGPTNWGKDMVVDGTEKVATVD
ncbi:hypothetical protein LINPERHAP1_LOCUS24316 [Linum perenne]